MNQCREHRLFRVDARCLPAEHERQRGHVSGSPPQRLHAPGEDFGIDLEDALDQATVDQASNLLSSQACRRLVDCRDLLVTAEGGAVDDAHQTCGEGRIELNQACDILVVIVGVVDGLADFPCKVGQAGQFAALLAEVALELAEGIGFGGIQSRGDRRRCRHRRRLCRQGYREECAGLGGVQADHRRL